MSKDTRLSNEAPLAAERAERPADGLPLTRPYGFAQRAGSRPNAKPRPSSACFVVRTWKHSADNSASPPPPSACGERSS